MADANLVAFEDGRSREVWLDPSEVQTARAMKTRYGNRILVTMKGGGTDLWLDDSPESRGQLGLT